MLNEATESIEQVQTRLDGLKRAFDSRKAEMEDDSLWSHMPRVAKISYMKKLESLEAEIARAEKKLARVTNGQPEEEEATFVEPIGEVGNESNNMEDYIKDQVQEEQLEDIEAEIIANPEAQMGTAETVINTKESLRATIELRRQIETLINSTEDLLLDENMAADVTIAKEMQEILTKFKTIHDLIDSASAPKEDLEPVIHIVTNSDELIAKAEEETDLVLEGNVNDKFIVPGLTVEQLEDDINQNYYVWDDESGLIVIEGTWNPAKGQSHGGSKTKMDIRYWPVADGIHFGVEPHYTDYNYKEDLKIAKFLRQEILNRIQHGSVPNTTTEL